MKNDQDIDITDITASMAMVDNDDRPLDSSGLKVAKWDGFRGSFQSPAGLVFAE